MATILGIFGLQGSGKTMLMTSYAYRDFLNGKKIYSNYHLKGIDYIPISSLDDLHKMKNGVALLDELWLYLFSRTSQSNLNKEIMKLVMLNRKRGLDIYYTAQLNRSVDVMLREVTQYFIYPKLIPLKNGDKVIYHIKYGVFDRTGFLVSDVIVLKHDVNYWGQFYDTTQEIGSLKTDKSPIEKGIGVEKKFADALRKVKGFKYVELLPNSGWNSTWSYDVIGYRKDGVFAFDVKGIGNGRVYLDSYGNALKSKIRNAYEHNATPYIVFHMDNKKQLTNPKFWYIHKLNIYSYLLGLSSYPSYNKLVKNSELLINI